MEDTYSSPCSGYTSSYLYPNIHDANSNEVWNDLETGNPSSCGSWYIPTSSTISSGGQYQNADNVTYKGGQIGLAKRTQDSVSYSPLGSDFSGTKQYGQDNTAPTTTVEGIADSITLYGPVTIHVEATDAGTGIDRVEWYVWVDSGEYESFHVDHTKPYTANIDLADYPGTTYYFRVYTYDEAWNYTLNQIGPISYDHFERIGQGCTSAFYIDWDCDGYGVGEYLRGPDADDEDATMTTWKSVQAAYGQASDHLNVKAWLTDVKGMNLSGVDIYYIDPTSGNDGTAVVNDPDHPWQSFNESGHPWALMDPGDVIVLIPGSHTGNPQMRIVDCPGDATAPAYIYGWPGSLTRWQSNQNIILGGSQGYGDGLSVYTVFDGFELRATADDYALIQIFGGASTTFHDLTFRNLHLDMNEVGHNGFWVLHYHYNILIDRVVAPECDRNCYTSLHPFYLGGNDYYQVHDVTVQNSIAYGGCGVGLYFNGWGYNVIFDSNISHSNESDGVGFYRGVTNSVMKNNISFDNQNNPFHIDCYDDAQEELGPHDMTGNTIINNTAYSAYTPYYAYSPAYCQSSGSGWHFAGLRLSSAFGATYDIGSQVIKNNVFICPGVATCGSADHRPISSGRLDWLTSSTIQNNILYTWEASTDVAIAGTTCYSESAFNALSSSISGNVRADPLLSAVDPDDWCTKPYWKYWNLDITSLSPARDFGVISGAPLDDIHGDTRSGNPDAGADEYSIGDAPTSKFQQIVMKGSVFQ